MDIDELIDLIDGLDMADPAQRALVRELLSAKTNHFNSDNFVVEGDAFIARAAMRSQQTLTENVDALRTMVETAAQGRPTQAVVQASYSLCDNWVHMISDLIVPWKQFTADI